MPFLDIDGFEVEIFNQSARRGVMGVGQRERSMRGQIRDARQFTRREWRMQAKFADFDVADAWERMIEGRGHYARLQDGLAASTSLQPLPGYRDRTFVPSFADPFGGTGAIETSGVDDFLMRYDCQFEDDEWTVVWWGHRGSWSHFARRSDQQGFKDGVRDDSIGTGTSLEEWIVEVHDGVVTLRMFPAGLLRWSHLLLLPYRVPDAVLVAWAARTTPFSPLPVITVSGDFAPDLTEIQAVGEVTGVSYVQHGPDVLGDPWVNDAKQIDFTLREVEPAFLRAA